ncbi:YciI family protein [Wenzhouxiangella sp. XN79A]|uniref:YciI family protein n=1 Tax=Wenzhouxiangella sp. XN79A TaxID=2724193 RepID=UPI00144AE648|nr:YciI family protein [Wenzhouxiangella sp. XN79A]NKI36272.1 YciI family protein [Wenzhouxiangella sp. XN79A]
MLYMILGIDADDSRLQRAASRGEHLARLEALRDEGRLVLAGPLPAIDAEDPGPAGFTGSLVVAEFASLDDARAWAEADPYIASGAWTGADVRPFKAVLP